MKHIINLLIPKPLCILGEIAGMLGLGSAVQGLFGQEFASDEATAARDHSAEQAQLNRNFQENMRATQYQTAVTDMAKAGLNPMLAYHHGGAGTPSGALSSSAAAATPNMSNLSNMQTAAQIKLLEKQADNVEADTAVKRDQIIERDESGEIRLPKTFEMRLKHYMGDREWYEAKNALEKVYLTKEETNYIGQRIKNLITENRIGELNIPRLINEARAQESDYMKYIAPYTGEIGKLVHSASEAKEAFSGRISIRRR